MGYRVTPAGRARCAELVAAESRAADQSVVSAIYEKFCSHNQDLKEIIKDWQMRDDEPNDHSDADYDRQVLDRLIALHEQVLPVLDDVSAAAPRLSHYRARLVKAAEAVAAGDVSFVSKPIVDSYHTVWFELHEDLDRVERSHARSRGGGRPGGVSPADVTPAAALRRRRPAAGP